MAFCLHGTVSSGAGYQYMHFEKLSRSHCPIYLDSQKTGLFWTDGLLWQLFLETQKIHPSSRPSSCENSFPIFCRPVSVDVFSQTNAASLPLWLLSPCRNGRRMCFSIPASFSADLTALLLASLQLWATTLICYCQLACAYVDNQKHKVGH